MSESNGHDAGGLGENLYDGRKQGTRDTRLIMRALKNRWPITDKMKGPVIEKLVGIISNAGTAPREAISAAKALIAAEAQNQSDEHKLLDKTAPDQHEHTHVQLTDAQRAARIEAIRAKMIEGQPGQNGHTNGRVIDAD